MTRLTTGGCNGAAAFAFLLSAAVTAAPGQQESARGLGAKPAVPVDPVAGIIGACRSHQVVALGEAHDNEQEQAVRLALIRDPRFPDVVNDIVVEFGNARYQELMDRFVRGGDVPEPTLRQVWQNTTQHAVWDSPIYEEFFRAVRDVNRSLPQMRQLRVLLGDPPIDWDTVRGPQDHWKWMLQRDSFPAELVQREVIQKQRHALLMYGDSHLQRQPIETNYSDSSDPRFNTLVSFLGRVSPPARLFTILVPTSIDLATIQPSIASWDAPRLATTRGTVLGQSDFVLYFKNPPDRRTVQDGALAPVARDQWRKLPLEEQFDAVLYLGPPHSLTARGVSPSLCSDPVYMQMRESRFAAVNAQRGFDALKDYCLSLKK